MAEQGYLAIADITGYTAYLNESELEHAQDSLSTILNLLIDQTKPPLTISRLEGDAVISFARRQLSAKPVDRRSDRCYVLRVQAGFGTHGAEYHVYL